MRNVYVSVLLVSVLGCGEAASNRDTTVTRRALVTNGGLSGANLALQESGNSCWGSGAQDNFQVTNSDSTTFTLSDVTIKYWVNDTSAANVVPHVWYGGCITSSNGTCVHPVANVTATATRFPACGPDPQHQADWEITISTTDTATLAPGATWSNIQSALNLDNFAPFTPGPDTWYSSCGTGQPFHADPHFAVYVRGALVTTNGIAAPSCRAPQGGQPIPSYTPPPTTPQVGTLPPDQVLTLALSLPVRNLPTLQATIDAAATPGSPTYRKWLTPSDLQANYLPLASDYAQLTSWGTSHGFQITSSSNNMVVGLTGTVATIERAFFVNLITVQRPDGTVYYTPDRAPTIDFPVTVLGVSGIDSFIFGHPAFSGGRSPIAGSFQSNDFRTAYLGAPPSTCAALTGTGQTIGIYADIGGFNPADIAAYQTNTGLAGVPAVQVDVAGTPDGVTPTPFAADGSGPSDETSLDIEMVMAMAPGAQIVVFEGNNTDLILDDMVKRADIAQFSSSWTRGAGATTTQLHTVMAALGQAFFEASGDNGSYAQTTVAPSGGNPGCGPFPAGMTTDMPYITLVGGTELNANAGAYVSESAWGGSSGGILSAVPLPSWQSGINPANALLSATSRNVPDVAMPANGIYLVSSGCDNKLVVALIGGPISPAACTGNIQCKVSTDGKTATYLGCKAGGVTPLNANSVGGTSAATPLWTAFFALSNQQNQASGRIGFPNPTLYGIAKGANAATSFHDITGGSPNAACDGTQFPAVNGYDQVTGLGSPQCGLVGQLSPAATPPPPTPHLSVSGNVTQLASEPVDLCGKGTNFTPGATVTLTLTNVPGIGDTTVPPFSLGTFTVGADGTFSYSIPAGGTPPAINCTDAQRFFVPTVTATDAQQEIASDTFTAGPFCLNVTTAGEFGGGCP